MAKFARVDLGKKTAGILKDLKNPYSVGLAENFKNSFKKLGGSTVAEEVYSADDCRIALFRCARFSRMNHFLIAAEGCPEQT